MATFIAYRAFDLNLVTYRPLDWSRGLITDTGKFSFDFQGVTYPATLGFNYDFGGAQSIVLGGTDLAVPSVTPPSFPRVTGSNIELIVGYSGSLGSDPVANYALIGKVPVTLWNDVTTDTVPGDAVAIFSEALKGADLIQLSGGDDVISGFGGNDRIEGKAGNDFLFGGRGNDLILAGADADFISGDAGDDILNGGSGIDTAYYRDASAGVTVNLSLTGSQNTAGAGIDQLSNIENIIGTDFADQLSGSLIGNEISGGDGNDTLFGLGGNDVLRGGIGNNVLDGGTGADTVSYSTSTGVKVSLALTGAQLVTADTADTLIGIENLVGSGFADVLRGDAGVNILRGGGGADRIYGGGGNDVLFGASGQDFLDGGAGNDRLEGQDNSDVLKGGTGADRFVLAFDYSVDQIADFSSTQRDKVELSLGRGFSAAGFAFAAGPGGPLSADEFHSAPGATEAHDASDRIIYNSTTGELYCDPDGTGEAGQSRLIAVFASITSIFDPAPVLTASDFVIVA